MTFLILEVDWKLSWLIDGGMKTLAFEAASPSLSKRNYHYGFRFLWVVERCLINTFGKVVKVCSGSGLQIKMVSFGGHPSYKMATCLLSLLLYTIIDLKPSYDVFFCFVLYIIEFCFVIKLYANPIYVCGKVRHLFFHCQNHLHCPIAVIDNILVDHQLCAFVSIVEFIVNVSVPLSTLDTLPLLLSSTFLLSTRLLKPSSSLPSSLPTSSG